MKAWLCILISLLISGCAVSHAPGGYLPDPQEAQSNVFGGWITIELKNQSSGPPGRMGELIAVQADSVFVLEEQGLAVFSVMDVSKAYLERYNNQWGKISAWGFLGTLSTLSHGFLLVMSAPLWIVTWVASSSSASHEPVIEYPDDGWSQFIKFCRFPQGLASSVDRTSLKPNLPVR